jgi:hypothetical protein
MVDDTAVLLEVDDAADRADHHLFEGGALLS